METLDEVLLDINLNSIKFTFNLNIKKFVEKRWVRLKIRCLFGFDINRPFLWLFKQFLFGFLRRVLIIR